MTGVNMFVMEVVAKRLRLLHDLLPKASRVAVFINPANDLSAKATLRGMSQKASGLQIQVFNASTIRRDRCGLYGHRVGASRCTLRRSRYILLFSADEYRPVDRAARGFRLSYGVRHCRSRRPDELRSQCYRHVSSTRRLIPAASSRPLRPADLPVLQTTKFELVIQPLRPPSE